MSYDAETLERRARRRIEQAFASRNDIQGRSVDHPIVLEIGCGRAENAGHILDCGADKYIGLDLNIALAYDNCDEDPRIELIEGSAEAIPMPECSIDFAVSFNVMEHLPNPELALNEIARLLRPRGSLFTTFGPPFNASAGPHLTRFIDLPYVHHLFPEQVVGEFTGRRDPYYTVNRRPLQYYRSALINREPFETMSYREHITGGGFWLLKSRTELGIELPLDELGIAAITTHLVKL